ncbi:MULTISPECIES: NAD(P)/FAD-dependent oxidoreductase [unclassified Rhodococcus (in: high G+C Gram-positive bacteria)]|uniref:NAD(P)/FAD-dependent oxidoreductase n=1 Tax=unclassified Rhodococcus (in: high G+C Gram-positive bacteria) TaxID=192944 RepID=UPI0006FBC590|nr:MULTISPECIES: FAD-dependent oxidoreductase [unclassified Rhodococcus (in: high G+C Gram-positive bacteria)]KQU28544.1 hypothetical protein ASG69_11150 [Rhodococcus sp. Leaf225]KQU47540.1 hypothetical protein ASH03_21830 [Rhodococcus sp. Leaf258]
MLTHDGTIVIVGGSIAGVTAAEELRSAGHLGPIVMIDEQPHQSYARPPLSKAVLTGVDSVESVALPPLQDSALTHMSDQRVVDVSIEGSAVILASGDRIRFDGLVIASGARPITMADLGRNPDGVPEKVLRTVDDARAIRDALATASSVIVIGGGILGMELASAAVEAGARTVVVSNEPPMRRQCGPFVSALVQRRAEARGVEFLIHPDGARLVTNGSTPGVDTGGSTITAELIVTAVGDSPNVDWLITSGLADRRGVQVDSRCRVTPTIVAAGDITTHGPSRRRHPHWSAAIDQGRTAARALVLGDAASGLHARPYFWTDQFGLALKMSGDMPFDGSSTVIEGSLDEFSALVQFSSDDGPVGALSLNRRVPMSRLHRIAAPSRTTSEEVRT